MTRNELPRIEGCGARVVPGLDAKGRRRKRPNAIDLQSAIDYAGATYRKRFGKPPSHIALPSDNTIAHEALKLWTLNLAHPTGPHVVIVGRPAGDNGTVSHGANSQSWEQAELF